MERFLDIFFSSFGLILLSPLLIIIMLILKFTGEGEVFFFQERVGRDGNQIKLYKFATMLKNSENLGAGTVTLKNDPRILPIGGFLRKTKINELPQLLNIFFGDMSVIGPRPQTFRCFNAFPTPSKKVIIKVCPGLSGIGSIVFRDEEEMMSDPSNADNFYDTVIMPYKGRLEEWYVENKCLSLYFQLIFVTGWTVLRPDSRVVWQIFKNLPEPPLELHSGLGLSGAP
jgi:lipopolysaccharide/colanic/teichoic acid biosynthesis glycosyltransferase